MARLNRGKLASFTVVDRNPLDADPAEIDGIEVIGTFFRGGAGIRLLRVRAGLPAAVSIGGLVAQHDEKASAFTAASVTLLVSSNGLGSTSAPPDSILFSYLRSHNGAEGARIMSHGGRLVAKALKAAGG